MIVLMDGLRVDVCDVRCGDRECFQLGYDKGTFSQGRGYTSYHKDKKGKLVERAVCMTRHLHGCPSNSVCHICRHVSCDNVGSKCGERSCDGVTIELLRMVT